MTKPISFIHKNQVDTLKKLTALNNIFKQINGYDLSFMGRQEKKPLKIFSIGKWSMIWGDSSFTYGEIKFLDFIQVLSNCQPDKNKIFCDLGSGVGKACFIASFFFDFKKAVGIELLPTLHQGALQAQNLIPDQFKERAQKLHFIEGDILQEDFSDADVVLCNSTCYSRKMNKDLTAKLENLKIGSYVIFLTRYLDSEKFTLIWQTRKVKYSWGKTTTAIYKKII